MGWVKLCATCISLQDELYNYSIVVSKVRQNVSCLTQIVPVERSCLDLSATHQSFPGNKA